MNRKFTFSWEFVGVLIALAIGLPTIYYTVKADRTKSLSVSYTTKKALLLTDAGKAGPKVEVSVSGRQIAQPWLVTFTIKNDGNIPIEERDVEAPLRLQFERSKVVSSEIVKKNQDSVGAEVTNGSDYIILTHKLLNPGDFITVDVLLDGEPAMPPSASCRISGVSTVSQAMAIEEQQKLRPSAIPLPRSANLVLLLVGSISVGVLIIAGLVVIVESISRSTKKSNPSSLPPRKSTDEIIDEAIASADGVTRTGKITLAYTKPHLSRDDIKYETSFRKIMSQHVPEEVFKSLGTNGPDASKQTYSELLLYIKIHSASSLFTSMPTGLDATARNEIMDLDKGKKMSLDDIVNTLEKYIRLRDIYKPDPPKISWSDLAGGLIVLAAGLSLVQFIIPSWINIWTS